MIGMNPNIQSVERDENGVIKDVIMNILEKTESDGLRSRVISAMCTHFAMYENIDEHIVNADLPRTMRYESIQDRIASMAESTEMVGEIEIIATCRTLQRRIYIACNDAVFKYGSEYDDQEPLWLKLTKMGEDVGHYDCLCETIGNGNEFAATESTCDKVDDILQTSRAPVISAAPHTPTPIKIRADISCNRTGNAKFITPVMLSPVTKMSMSRAAISAQRRASHSEILTSSPYKEKLIAVQSKAKPPKKKADMRRKRDDIGRTRKKINLTERQRCKKSKYKKPNDSESEPDKSDNDPWYCPVCDEDRKEDMVRCVHCGTWIHNACAGGVPPNFQCDLC